MGKITKEQIAEATLGISVGKPWNLLEKKLGLPKGIGLKEILAYHASINDMTKRLGLLFDDYESQPGKGATLDRLVEGAARNFFEPSEHEKMVPLRKIMYMQINYKDCLMVPHALIFSDRGEVIGDEGTMPCLTMKRYVTYPGNAHEKKNGRPLVSIQGEKISGFDEGFADAFAAQLGAAINDLNTRLFYREKDAMLSYLDGLMADESQTIEQRRQKMINEVVGRTKSKEGYVVLIKAGRKPTIDSISADDLEIGESKNGFGVDDEKTRYILEKALHVIKTPDVVNVFDDGMKRYGYALATELKLKETKKMGGAFVLFDDRGFSSARQELAGEAGMKVDDFIIFNREMREEIEQRKRIEQVFIPMVGKEQAKFLLEQHDLKRFAEPTSRFVVVLYSDMKGSTNAADSLMTERKRLETGNPELHKKYHLYINSINDHLGCTTEAVLRFGGVIDKYIGDAVMAEWGIPVGIEEQQKTARRAVLAAVYANKLTSTCNKRMEEEGIDDIFIFQQRFILHSGVALAGIYGTELRYNYTVMGASVNEAARIEGLPASEVGKVTLSGEFLSLVNDVVEVEKAGQFKLKGKEDPVDLYHFRRFTVNDFNSFAKEHINPGISMPESQFFRDYVMGKGDDKD